LTGLSDLFFTFGSYLKRADSVNDLARPGHQWALRREGIGLLSHLYIVEMALQ
jgi:hypothetical protein